MENLLGLSLEAKIVGRVVVGKNSVLNGYLYLRNDPLIPHLHTKI